MSAARNVSAWKVLSVTPNCLRLLRYVRGGVEGDLHRAERLVARDDAGDRRGPARSRTAASPPAPSGVGRGVGERRPGRRGRRRGSGSRRGSARRRRRSTTNRPVPPSGERRADHEHVGAGAVRHRLLDAGERPARRPTPVAVTDDAVACQREPGSACANASTRLARRPARRAASAFCSSEPAAATRPPASTTEVRNGSGASTRPSSCATMPTSTGPAPMPPSSSANGRPSTPISASRGPQLLVEARVLGDGAAAVLEVGVRLADQAAHGLAQGLLLARRR